MKHTEHYQLNQWEANDKVQRVDFNRDNEKIDQAIMETKGAIPKILIGTYQGAGSAGDTTVTVGFPIKVLIVTGQRGIDGDYGIIAFPGMTITGGSTGQVFWFTEDGFRVRTAMYDGRPCTPYLNDTKTYRYIAFG